MIVKYYSIKDTVADEFGDIMSAKNDGIALRHFSQAISKVDYKDEFLLFEIGSFDTESGCFVALTAPRLVQGSYDD